MIRVICGDDEFAVSNALNRHLDALTSPELREANVTVFDSPTTRFSEVINAVMIVPFISDKRAVVVKGMLAPFATRGGKPAKDWLDLGKWASRDGMSIPNVLIFVDQVGLEFKNAVLKSLAGIGEVERFMKPPYWEERDWSSLIQTRAKSYGLDLEEAALSKLAALSGRNTLQIDSELQKLALFADGRRLSAQQVETVASDAHGQGIFQVLDNVIDGNARAALDGLHSMVRQGESTEGLIFLLARQLRILIQAKMLLANRTPAEEIGKRVGVYKKGILNRTLRQASRSVSARLSRMHRRVLEVDLATKTGELDRKLSVELLIADLASR